VAISSAWHMRLCDAVHSTAACRLVIMVIVFGTAAAYRPFQQQQGPSVLCLRRDMNFLQTFCLLLHH
jgi:hypothetical protein